MFGHDKAGEKWGFWKIGHMGEANRAGDEERAEANEWTEAMEADDTPEFAGEWGYGEQKEDDVMDETVEVEETEEDIFEDEVAGARKITSYGFDTASRLYGLETVIDTIVKTNEIVGNAENPLGVVYQALVPDVRERERLYWEIRKDSERAARYNNGNTEQEEEALGFNREGDFYDKAVKQPGREQKSVEAIRAVRRLMETLENDEKFDKLREKAYQKDQTLIECLMGESDRPTVSQFLNSIDAFGDGSGEISEEMVDEVLNEVRMAEDEQSDKEELAAS